MVRWFRARTLMSAAIPTQVGNKENPHESKDSFLDGCRCAALGRYPRGGDPGGRANPGHEPARRSPRRSSDGARHAPERPRERTGCQARMPRRRREPRRMPSDETRHEAERAEECAWAEVRRRTALTSALT